MQDCKETLPEQQELACCPLLDQSAWQHGVALKHTEELHGLCAMGIPEEESFSLVGLEEVSFALSAVLSYIITVSSATVTSSLKL